MRGADGIELKFNPWHDPADGRFTFAGAGSRDGAARQAAPARRPIGSGTVDRRNAARARVKDTPQSHRDSKPNPVAEFAGGVGEGLYGVAEGAVEDARLLVTTNPATTARKLAYSAAGLVDAATAAENTPALTHIANAKETLAHASARDLGRATGMVAGNVALTVAPGAALSKVAALRRLRLARPRPTFDPPHIGWVKENLGPKGEGTPSRLYNNAAPNARMGQAPTLMRTMPNGSRRPVKFDGFIGEYLIDRKFGVTGKPRAVEQLERQSQALTENHCFATWEVPNKEQKIAALRLFKKHGITRIKVRIVEP